MERLREENSSQAKALREVTREREELAGELELMKAQVIWDRLAYKCQALDKLYIG